MKNHYLKFYHFIDNLNITNIKTLDKNIAVIYRNYKIKPDNNSIIKFRNYCRKNKQKFLISNYIDLVTKYNLDGFYIPSFNKKKFYTADRCEASQNYGSQCDDSV